MCKSFLTNALESCNAAFGKEESLLKQESIDSPPIGWADLLHGLGLWLKSKIAEPSKRILAPNLAYSFSGSGHTEALYFLQSPLWFDLAITIPLSQAQQPSLESAAKIQRWEESDQFLQLSGRM